TMAGILTGQLIGYSGSISIGGTELSKISERKLLDTVTLVAHNSHIFKGTVRYNLKMGAKNAGDTEMEQVLRKVRLWDFLKGENGLDTEIAEQGANFSGGQRQRLALARALLRDTPIYVFDEATSNIDIESENAINETIADLAAKKLVIIISHRLANAASADRIFVLNNGTLAEEGAHAELIKNKAYYAELFASQQSLEKYTEGGFGNEEKKKCC
ncbi:MAG: ATP-binding cassette domain-containing protein, partial [Candidatus Ornithomonoglobus sp.]